MFLKPPADFRLPSLDPETEAEFEKFRKLLSATKEKLADAVEQQKEALICQAASMTAPEAREQIHRFCRVFLRHGVERVYLDGQPLIEFQPGYIKEDTTEWFTPYRLYHRGNRP